MAIVKDKGKKTKQKIIDVTKNLFYLYGYNDVYVKDIAAACEISPGNLTYYFPTKDTIAVEIFTQYINNIFEFIDQNIPNLNHFYYKNLYMSLIFNLNVFNDKNTSRYYNEVMHEKSQHYLLRSRIQDVYRALLESFYITYDDDEYQYFSCADLGARHEILINFMDGNFPSMNIIKLVRILHNNTTKLMGIDQKIFDKMFDQVANSLDQYDFSHVKLL